MLPTNRQLSGRQKIQHPQGLLGARAKGEPGPGPARRPARTLGQGASALRLRARKVAKLVERLRTVAPWIEGSDLPCARSWAELEILGAACFRELVEKGVLNSEGQRHGCSPNTGSSGTVEI